MKELLVHPGPKTETINSPIPKPASNQLVIKVEVSGTNPKDWKMLNFMGPFNQGDDIAGIVHEVGENITEFKPGDRVAAFHQIRTPHGSFAEYAVAWGNTTFLLPKQTSFEEAATIPLAATTSALGLYKNLGLPQPWTPAQTPIPLIVYGASTAVGSFAIKLARLSNIHPIIAVAGKGEKYVSSLIDKSKGDAIVDYRKGAEAVVQGIRDALKAAGASSVSYAFDAVSEHGSYQSISEVLDPHGKITLVLPLQGDFKFPDTITQSRTMVSDVHKEAGETPGAKDFGHVFFRYFTYGLQQGIFSGHPYEVVPGGLGGVEKALKDLKDGKASAVKYVVRIAETEGVGRDKSA